MSTKRDREYRELDARVCALQDAFSRVTMAVANRLSKLETPMVSMEPGTVVRMPSKPYIVVHLKAAAERGNIAVATVGNRVSYYPTWAMMPLWSGVVIPLPVGQPRYSTRTFRLLTYVMKDGDHAIRGCFAENLVNA